MSFTGNVGMPLHDVGCPKHTSLFAHGTSLGRPLSHHLVGMMNGLIDWRAKLNVATINLNINPAVAQCQDICFVFVT